MTFDQIIGAWTTQEAEPLYGVNHDLLRLALANEQADFLRKERWERLLAYAAATGMIAVAGGVLLWFARYDGSVGHMLLAGLALVSAIGWVAALASARARQAGRERAFGTTLEGEIGRAIQQIDHRLSTAGRFTTALVWAAPVALAASLLLWLISAINRNTPLLFDVAMIGFVCGSIAWSAWQDSRKQRDLLLPRRQRLDALRALLERS